MNANLKAFSTEQVPQAIVVISGNPGGATLSRNGQTKEQV